MKTKLEFKIVLAFFCFLSFGIFTTSAKQKIACVGNSITANFGLYQNQGYPAQMQVLLGSTNWKVTNFGVSGRTMLKNGDEPYWNEIAYTNAKAFLPNSVIIELGTNDSKPANWTPHGSEFVSNYEEMIQVFQNLSSKPEVWISLCPPGNFEPWTILLVNIRDIVNPKIKQIALESGVGLIDLFDAFNGYSPNWYNTYLFLSDSVHPTQAGDSVIAYKVKEMMTMPKPQLTYTNGKIVSPTANGYQWYYNGVLILSSDGGNDQELVPTKIGRYKVSLKLNATNETRIVSNEIEITSLATELIENKDLSNLKIYPNPSTSGYLNIEMPENLSGIYQLAVYDLKGKNVMNQQITSSTKTLNIGVLANGVYMFQVKDQRSVLTTQMIKCGL